MPKLTIRFGEKTDELLKELAKIKGTTKSEIIRRALVTYKYLDDQVRDGSNHISIKSADDQTIKDVILP